MILIQHTGKNDPTTEGWQFLSVPAGVTTVQPITNDLGQGIDAWQVRDESNQSGLGYLKYLTSAESSRVVTQGWLLSATLRAENVPGVSVANRGGILFSYQTFEKRWALWFDADDNGNTRAYLQTPPLDIQSPDGRGGPLLSPLPLTKGYSTYTWVGRGAGVADLFINGWPLIRDYPGSTIIDHQFDNAVDFGGGSTFGTGIGNFSSVVFVVGACLPPPGSNCISLP